MNSPTFLFLRSLTATKSKIIKRSSALLFTPMVLEIFETAFQVFRKYMYFYRIKPDMSAFDSFFFFPLSVSFLLGFKFTVGPSLVVAAGI